VSIFGEVMATRGDKKKSWSKIRDKELWSKVDELEVGKVGKIAKKRQSIRGGTWLSGN
jgi:hypothetical protein